MVKCAVPSCKNDSRKQTKKNKDISFHRFPKCCELTKKWVIAIKRPNWEPNIWSFVCSMHFSASSFYETKGGLRKLVGGAIPELKLKDEAEEDPLGEKLMIPSMSQQSSNPSTNDDGTPHERKLKRQITNLQEIAKRRRLRCNALYVQRNRMKKKIVSLTKMIKELRQKQTITEKENEK